MILSKIKGLWMIFTALIPIIWIAILLNILFDVNHLAHSSVKTINSSFSGMITTLDNSTNSLSNSVEPIRNLENTLSEVSLRVNNIPVNIQTPPISLPDAKLPFELPTIPSFDILIPGLKDVKNILANNFDILNKFNQEISSIAGFEESQRYYQGIILSVQESIKEMQIIAFKIIALVVIGAIIVIPFLVKLLITPYIRWTRNRITTGWKLICS
ncbi:MAG: hypothetical protein SWZ49_13340 [Cyanobacteriota bacterium]|nr:hypothetical protein [Cyanobacteriota bacterium]